MGGVCGLRTVRVQPRRPHPSPAGPGGTDARAGAGWELPVGLLPERPALTLLGDF